jgi:hypothetical protein
VLDLGAHLVGLADERVAHGLVQARVDVGARLPCVVCGEVGFEAFELCLGDAVLALVGDHGRAPRSMAMMPLGSDRGLWRFGI